MEEEKEICCVDEIGSIFTIRNDIFFYDNIDNKSSTEFAKAIYDLYITTIQNCITTGLGMPPINIHIKSDGGSIIDTLQVIKVIKDIQHGLAPFYIPCEVNTYIEGVASSCASLVACVGTNRYAGKYSTGIIHDATFCYKLDGSKIEEIEDLKNNSLLIKKIVKDIYLEYTKISEQELDEILKNDKAYDAQWFLNNGFIDKIVN